MNTDTQINIRRAIESDVPSIISIYQQDSLNGHLESISEPLPDFYSSAFNSIDSDPNQLLLVAEHKCEILGSLQVTYIQYLIASAIRLAVIEALFVHPRHSDKGIGTALVRSAIESAKEARCAGIELTSNKLRERAHGFYNKLGFTSSHEGFKLYWRAAEQGAAANP